MDTYLTKAIHTQALLERQDKRRVPEIRQYVLIKLAQLAGSYLFRCAEVLLARSRDDLRVVTSTHSYHSPLTPPATKTATI
ncbi:hypothetical protein L873DRAFT_1809342 [Choiromyces venosus 120613-1]|uniref:Uncharacterized protein n=1 Tax=Choiromyces venosus 120613-1 TaxID=1336337 RepID=A0A3N4JHV9_9PEZI|nr:hypothetical protein L873DRAFT_1809342 [Choiromyces venosus 120613-1]